MKPCLQPTQSPKPHVSKHLPCDLPPKIQDGKLLDADPPEELAPKDATCPSEDGSAQHLGWTVDSLDLQSLASISPFPGVLGQLRAVT